MTIKEVKELCELYNNTLSPELASIMIGHLMKYQSKLATLKASK